MGTPNYAQIILEKIIDTDDIEVHLVITQPDRPVGRKKVLTAPPVKILAETNGIEVLQPERLKNDAIKEKIESLKPDFIIVAAFGQLLPKEILDIAPCINLHASLLPQYRGASPVQQSLLNGDIYSGVTAMLMEEGLDSGDILGYRYFKIPNDMGLKDLMSQLGQDACSLTLDTIRNFNHIEPMKQIKANASYCKKIHKSDGEVELSESKIIYNKYRAFEGWPGIYLKSGLKIIEMSINSLNKSHKEAEILDIKDSTIIVGCHIGSIEISTLQPPSKRAMDAKSYLLGRGLKVGDILV